MIPFNDFLLRAWLEKPESPFCGIPTALMMPKAVESYFPSVDRMLAEFGIEKIYPPSGFASGIRDISVWEERVRISIALEDKLLPLWIWNPQITARLSANMNEDKLRVWQHLTTNLSAPTDDYARALASPAFKFSREFPVWEEVKESL